MSALSLAGGILGQGRCPAELVTAASRPNPAHAGWLKRHERWRAGEAGYPGPEPARTLTCGGQATQGWWWVPRWLPEAREMELVDRRTLVVLADELVFQGELRDYQEAAVTAWELGGREGVIVAPCGAGKTILGLAAVARAATPTLILVHTRDLQAQWAERIQARLGVTPRLLGGAPRKGDPRICVAMLQSLARMEWMELRDLGREYGLVVLDEAHHAPAATWSRVLAALPSRWRLALTATPDRVDGLGDWLMWSCGPIRATIALGDLEEAGATLAPVVRIARTGWSPVETKSWAAIGGELAESVYRNACVVEEVQDLHQAGHELVLVLVDRVAHARRLAELLHGEVLVGEMPAKARRDVLQRAADGQVRVVVATSLADEGLDLPAIDAVVLAAPTRHPGRLQQRIGRALRPSPGKARPVVVDLVDDWGPLQGWARIRRATYQELGWAA